MTEIRLRELLSGLDTGDIILSWLSDEINKDMEAFSEWCFKSAVLLTNDEWDYYDKDGELKRKTTAQLRKIWEMETGRKEATE